MPNATPATATMPESSAPHAGLALYIHWPFCRSKCPYCDFNSHVARTEPDSAVWHRALVTEMRTMAARTAPAPLGSIFFGGGTPSLMPPMLVAALLDEAAALWSLAPDLEVTLEANPTSGEAARLQACRAAGVNRLSLGVQALCDADLRFLGREHSAAEALHTLEEVASLFPRYSFDLIYGRPQQTPKQWENELRRALAYHGGHLSCYQLTIEPETPFARFYRAGAFTLPDDETAAALYRSTEALCREAGLEAYEISNYAAAGEESRHNLAIWRGTPYLGIGPGAHGRLYQPDTGWCATRMLASPARWLAEVQERGHGLTETAPLSRVTRQEELLLCGLRLREGVPLEAVADILEPERLRRYRDQGFLETRASYLTLTPAGRLVTERLAAELLGA